MPNKPKTPPRLPAVRQGRKKQVQKPIASPASAARQGSPRKPESASAGHNIPKTLPAKSTQDSNSMQAGNREIIAAKFGIAPDSFLKYREEPGGLIVAILPNGQKHKFFQEAGSPNLLHIT